MVFFKAGTTVVNENREELIGLPNDTDIHVFFDTSGSFDAAGLAQIDAVVDDWVATFGASNPDWTGSVYKYNDATEQWVKYAEVIETTTYFGQDLSTKNIIVVSFCNEAEGTQGDGAYHGVGPVDNPLLPVTSVFTADYNAFTGTTHPKYLSFIGIHYPIVFGPGTPSSDLGTSRNFVLHSLAALKGTSFSLAEVNALTENLGFDTGEWATLKTSLQAANPYPDDGLENYGWLVQEDRYVAVDGTIITSQQFQDDIFALLEGSFDIVPIVVQITIPTLETMTIPGVEIGDIDDENNSWTMSYSLKNQSWVSWHSYLPSFYAHHANRFYSWKNGISNIYKHNIKGSYQNFYGVQEPHIIEYVINDEPTMTKLYDWLKFNTVAMIYDVDAEEFVEQRGVTHNKIMVYNQRQTSGILSMVYKHATEDDVDYLENQTVYTEGQATIDNDEGDWTVNDLRDIVTDVSVPLFTKALTARQAQYFIDKILNPSITPTDKDWTEAESFRGKFLVVRLIFDNFDTVQLTTRYSLSSEQESKR